MTNKLPNRTLVIGFVLGTCLLFTRPVLAQELVPLNAERPTSELSESATKEPQPVEESVDPSRQAAEKTLGEALEKLNRYDSIRFDIRETTYLGGRVQSCEGQYVQARGEKLRLFYEFSLPGADGELLKGSLLQVSDGSVMSSNHQIGEQLQVTTRDLKEINKALEQFPAVEAQMMNNRLGLGGLAAMLTNFKKSFVFDTHQPDTIGGDAVLMIAGGWKPSIVQQLTQGQGGETRPFPLEIPDRIHVYFDETTLFPRRVAYLKTFEKNAQSIVTLNFINVETNVTVSADDFTFYIPEGALPQDITPEIIQQIIQTSQLLKQQGSAIETPKTETPE